MGTGIGYRNKAHPRMKGRYGTGKICTCLTSLIKTIGGGKICTCLTSLIKTIDGEFSVHQRNPNHNYAYTRLQQILSRDSLRTSALSSVSCTGLWRRQGTESRITRIVSLPYPIPVPMSGLQATEIWILGSISCFGSSPVSVAFVYKQPMYNYTVFIQRFLLFR